MNVPVIDPFGVVVVVVFCQCLPAVIFNLINVWAVLFKSFLSGSCEVVDAEVVAQALRLTLSQYTDIVPISLILALADPAVPDIRHCNVPALESVDFLGWFGFVVEYFMVIEKRRGWDLE